ncbi:dopamine receptor D4 [Mycolicibacterium sarraceniae]|uniref:dopamine receptor D4 n=1 Tax=Mycolicibacterium sarraceniae TaxID=1534348 RepID=UPI001F166703|nr:dopamine receptor D4 [Mycolicibacterium sarraceniae]
MSPPVPTSTWARRACLGLGALGVATAVLSAPAAWADPADPAVPIPAPTDTTSTAVAPAPVQHLSSPDNLPPGTSADSPAPQSRLNYWRDLLHAMRTQDVSGSDALLLLTQRPLDANAVPPPGMAAGPSGPIGTSAVAPGVDASAPAPG